MEAEIGTVLLEGAPSSYGSARLLGAPMSAAPDLTRIIVVQRVGTWQVLCPGQEASRFDFSVDAVDAAIRTARTRMAKGETVELLVQDWSGRLRNMNPEDGGELH